MRALNRIFKEFKMDSSPAYCGKCHVCLDRAQDAHERLFRGMILCPTCGNKRCPKATEHRLECTGSNEPGQKGSVFR